MKRYLSTIILATMILGIGLPALMPQEVYAVAVAPTTPAPAPATPAASPSLFGSAVTALGKAITSSAVQLLPTTSWTNSLIAYTGQTFLMVTSVFVTAAATFLSVSINLTTHIKDIYDRVNGINIVWTTVRDLSSMFIIFMLLYFSILTIVGRGEGKIGKLIVNIFLAGIFINFSLFFVRIAIDASNLVSLQFYNAITPTSQTTGNPLTVASNYFDGGFSNVLLQSLKVQTVYKSASAAGGLDISTGIIFATIGGILIMITTAFSLLAASIAFTARTAILLFIMAISPIFFAGMIFPKLKEEVSDPILKLLKGQLIFMPVYLFLMYVALKIISDPNFNAIFNQAATGVNASSATFAYVWTGIIIQYTIALLFINVPLIAAISLSGTKGFGMKWAPTAKSISGFFGQHTVGRTARGISDRIAKSDFATNNPNLAVLANKGLGKVSGQTFGGTKGGYDARVKEYAKERVEYGKKLKTPEAVSAGYIASEMGEWERRMGNERRNKAYQLTEIERKKQRFIDMSGDTGLNQNQSNKDQLAKLEEEENEIKDELGQDMDKARNTEIERLKKVSKNLRANEFASNLSESSNFLTSKARKDAADTLRKDLNKGGDEKALDILESILKKGEGESKPEVKP